MSDEAVKNTLSDCKMSFFRITEITKKFTNHVDSELLETEILPSESDTNENNLNSGDLLVDSNSSEVDREIDISLNDTNNLKYQHAVKYKISENEIEETLNDEVNHYDLSKGTPISTLNIQIDRNEIKRFSCGNHKLNLAIRHAIQAHEEVALMLFNLNKSNSHIRNTIKLNKVKH